MGFLAKTQARETTTLWLPPPVGARVHSSAQGFTLAEAPVVRFADVVVALDREDGGLAALFLAAAVASWNVGANADAKRAAS